ncbi:MAG: threonine/serine exporter family protein [Eubacterium sp.]|nr:threonine/serine exporter family protein [Eubacterium sp.]
MDYERLMQAILDVGEEMLVHGAEVNRVQDAVIRMCESYGYTRVNVFCITTNLQLTAEAPDGKIITQIRTITRNNINFDKLDYLNDLSRRICKGLPEPQEIQERLEKVLQRGEPPRWMILLGGVMVSGGFTAFFGGNWKDTLAGIVLGMIIVLFQEDIKKRENNPLVINFIASLAAGLLAILLVRLGIGSHVEMVMIAGIMLLIPGVAMTNAIKDMLLGDLATGLLRLTDSLINAFAIVVGFTLSMFLTGGVL